ncbi:MAG: DUF1566 domain-containing protein, partial [Myxococcales bacterium]|nr:DUF1566 domain-containing protein [Myxococcales bacterium]
VDHGDGTVTDRWTALMWASTDTGKVLDWDTAARDASRETRGGHRDWRLPTADELATLRGSQFERVTPECAGGEKHLSVRVAPEIRLTCIELWAADAREGEAVAMDFVQVVRPWRPKGEKHPRRRALYVREDSAAWEALTSPSARETQERALARAHREGRRFVDHGDGTFTDLQTALMWPRIDGAFPVDWREAQAMDRGWRGGGYRDWRMPTVVELEWLNDLAHARTLPECFFNFPNRPLHVPELLRLTCVEIWAAGTEGTSARVLDFTDEQRRWRPMDEGHALRRALPVRLDDRALALIRSPETRARQAERIAAARAAGTRFVDLGDGTVRDTRTGLEWAARDNGTPVDWREAVEYAKVFRQGGRYDWRLPTLEELRGLLDPHATEPFWKRAGYLGQYRPACSRNNWDYGVFAPPEIRLSCTEIWAADRHEDAAEAAYLSFHTAEASWRRESLAWHRVRVLPVRDAERP